MQRTVRGISCTCKIPKLDTQNDYGYLQKELVNNFFYLICAIFFFFWVKSDFITKTQCTTCSKGCYIQIEQTITSLKTLPKFKHYPTRASQVT